MVRTVPEAWCRASVGGLDCYGKGGHPCLVFVLQGRSVSTHQSLGLSPGPPNTSYQKSLGPWIVYNLTGVPYEGRNESQKREQRPSQAMAA